MRHAGLMLACAAGALASAAVSAQGAVTTIGTGHARACYQAAEFKQPFRPSIETCNMALQQEALSLQDRVATLVNRGIVYMHVRQLEKAIADYDSALKAQPNLAEAYVNKGIALVHMGGADEAAIATLSQGLTLNPDRPEVAYFTRGVAHEISGDTRAAYNDYKQAAALKPDWIEPKAQLQRFTVVRKGG